MIYFNCDYNEGCHPKIMEKLIDTNLHQSIGYGMDEHCEHSRELIREACGLKDAGIHFLVGGTQANFVVIKSALRPHQAVVSPESGHINVHEAAAVESTGHKVISVPCDERGKLTASQVEEVCALHYIGDPPPEHMAQPKMVYISHPTENGALYTKAELAELAKVCEKYGLYLFCDGARMGYGLASDYTDVTLKDLGRYCDAFYIGGTKCGALFGEAVVIKNPEIDKDFRYAIKQNGGMLAKGRLLGIQFEVLFENDLYTEICGKADKQAYRIAEAFKKAGFKEFVSSPTNQQFFILPDETIKKLSEKYVFSGWGRIDDTHSAVRVCTSWATPDENVDALIADISQCTM